MSRLQSNLLDFLEIGELSFELGSRERRALLIVSALPALYAVLKLIELGFLVDGAPYYGFNPPGDMWLRLYGLATFAQTSVAYLGLAVMVIFGIGGMTRPEASWCLMASLSLVVIGLLATSYSTLLYVASVPDDLLRYADWYGRFASSLTVAPLILAVGYAFLAFRGLAPRDGE